MPAGPTRGRTGRGVAEGRYKWVALSNTTLGMLVATINSSIVIISLPAIFRGIGLNPLRPGNVSYLLWMLMGYLWSARSWWSPSGGWGISGCGFFGAATIIRSFYQVSDRLKRQFRCREAPAQHRSSRSAIALSVGGLVFLGRSHC